MSDGLAKKIAELTGATIEEVKTAKVSRDFDGMRYIGFPNASPVRSLPAADAAKLSADGAADIGTTEATKSEEGLKEETLGSATDIPILFFSSRSLLSRCLHVGHQPMGCQGL